MLCVCSDSPPRLLKALYGKYQLSVQTDPALFTASDLPGIKIQNCKYTSSPRIFMGASPWTTNPPKPSQRNTISSSLSAMALASSPCPALMVSSQAHLPVTCLILWLSDPWYSMVRYCTMALAASVLPDPLCPLQEREVEKLASKQRYQV